MAEGNKVAASKDTSAINTLSTTMVRLPLGHWAADTSDNAATLYHFLVPTKAGGTLTLTLEAKGEMTLYAHDGATILAGPTTFGVLSHHLAPSTRDKPTHGRYYLLVKGPSPRRVGCTFTQSAIARDGKSSKDPPLIPWNFFFWPSAKTFSDGTANPHIKTMESILARYEKAYGHSPAKAVKWENDNHLVDKGETWVGHCHLSARASILFEQPGDAKIKVPGKDEEVSFTQEELEFLAAEWFGTWAQSSVVWNADQGEPPWGRSHDFTDDAGNVIVKEAKLPKIYWHRLLKPADLEAPEKELRAALKDAILVHRPALASVVDEEMVNVFVGSHARRQEVKELFGKMAASFYETLVQKLYHEHEALVADLRGDGGGNPPTEVWNHAIFKFHARFLEVLPSEPERESLKNEDLMIVGVELVANWDYSDAASATPPAIVGSDHSVQVEGGGVQNRRSVHTLRLRFDASTGEVRREHKDHRWFHCRNAEKGDELYVPAIVVSVLPVGTTVSNSFANVEADSRAVGNAALDLDLVSGPSAVLGVRKRYRK